MIHRSSLHPQITNFVPVGDKVLLKRHARPEKVGAIFMPGQARFVDLAKFDVVMAGKDCKQIKAGDTVFAPCQLTFSKFEMNEIEFEVAPESILSAYIPHD